MHDVTVQIKRGVINDFTIFLRRLKFSTSRLVTSTHLHSILLLTMSSLRAVFRAVRPSMAYSRPLTTTTYRLAGPGNAKEHPNTEGHRDAQKERPLNPHITNTNSTSLNEMPSVGADKPPPELISSVDPEFVLKDSVPENTERMTGETQKGDAESNSKAELAVGELQGGKFRIEPLRRTGEDANTMRARLLCAFRRDLSNFHG